MRIKTSKHIIYLEVNDLHGFEMSRFFPTSRFKWINPKDFEINQYNKNS